MEGEIERKALEDHHRDAIESRKKPDTTVHAGAWQPKASGAYASGGKGAENVEESLYNTNYDYSRTQGAKGSIVDMQDMKGKMSSTIPLQARPSFKDKMKQDYILLRENGSMVQKSIRDHLQGMRLFW